MHYVQWPFVVALFLVFVLPTQLKSQPADPIPASEVIGVLVQFVAGDFGNLEFVGNVRLQNLSANPCFVTVRFAEGAGQLPSVPLLTNGVPIQDGALTELVLARREHILQIRTAESGQLFRGSVLAHSNDHGCADIVSLQGGYQIRSSEAVAQGAGGGIIEIAAVRPGSLLTEGKCISGPLPPASSGGVVFVGGAPFTQLTSGATLRISGVGNLGPFGAIAVNRPTGEGQFQAFTEEDLFSSSADPSAFGDRRLQVCLEDSQPDEAVYVQLGEFQTDRTGNVQTAQPVSHRTLPCESSRTSLCLNQHRFQATASWSTQTQGGTGVARPLTGNTGAFDFSNDENAEFDALVQVIDACEQAGHYWVSVASTSTAHFTIEVTDLVGDQIQEYTNPLGNEFQPVFDTQTFANCP